MDSEVTQLIASLADKSPVIREQSRKQLVKVDGPDVLRGLVMALIDTRQRVRWEAAKALHAIKDPVAAPALLQALDDTDEDVRWVAGEGLIALDKVGLLTVLSGLTKQARSIAFCKAAHHVLHEMRAYQERVAPVLKALEESEPAVAAPPVAFDALVAFGRESGSA